LQLHQLTQAILRDQLTASQSAAARAYAETILAANHPGSSDDPVNWPAWARLLPHLLAVDPAATTNAGLRDAARDAAWYLLVRGEILSGNDVARDLYRQWRARLGPGDPTPCRQLTASLTHYGRWAAMPRPRRLDEDTLAQCRMSFGDDHPNTLISASNLAIDMRRLGQLQAARELDDDALARERRMHGDDHPGTLTAANNLAVDLHELGEVQAARKLDEDTLARRRLALGTDHPDVLTSVSNPRRRPEWVERNLAVETQATWLTSLIRAAASVTTQA
jgi:hypothetical protein